MTELDQPHPASQNALKHRLFATKSCLIPGETQEELDKFLYWYKRELNPKGPIEEDLALQIAHAAWRRRRIPDLEAASITQAIEAGEPIHKSMGNFTLYGQRLTRTVESIQKQLEELQLKRKREVSIAFRIALILYKHNDKHNIPWDPAADGFVFSRELIGRGVDLVDRFAEASVKGSHNATPEEIDMFFTHMAM